jgi:hypothetical protein
VTNNEARVAHRILQKHGIQSQVLAGRLPLTSDQFLVKIDGLINFSYFDDVKKYVASRAKAYTDAADEIAEAVRRDANGNKP